MIQDNEKGLIKFAAVPGKTLKIVNALPNILLMVDIMDLCLLSGVCLLSGHLESATKLFMPDLALSNFKSSEPADS